MHSLIKYVEIRETKSKPIQEFIKEFVADIVKLYCLPDDKIIGIGVGLPKKIDGELIFPMECLYKPEIHNYQIAFLDTNLNFVNKRLYDKYLPDTSDKLAKLHNLYLQLLNEVGKKGVDLDDADYYMFYKNNGVDLDYIFLGDMIGNLDKVIDTLRRFIEITKALE